jgi:hypothetical protein
MAGETIVTVNYQYLIVKLASKNERVPDLFADLVMREATFAGYNTSLIAKVPI